MIDLDLFPSSAHYVALTDALDDDLTHYDALDTNEQDIVSDAVPKRRAEFGDARWCAHQALGEMGCPSMDPILKGEHGMPLWPDGVVGSLTHTTGFRAAVVADSSQVRAVGLDAEPAEPVAPGFVETIARPGEIPQLFRLREAGVECADRLLFSAKEATFKSWYPMTRRWLEFGDAEVDLRDDGTFLAYLLVRPTPLPFINGRWVIRDGIVITSTHVPQIMTT